MLNRYSIASLLLFLQHVYFLNAWIPNLKYPRRLIPERTFQLSAGQSEDINPKRTQIEKTFYNDDKLSRKKDKIVHIVGLFESLSTMPVEEWAGYNNDLEEGYWMNTCRDDDCEVS